MKKSGILIVISGPSATGKGTVCKSLMEVNPNLEYSTSVTTREPRKGEKEGINYFFRTPEEFQQMIRQDELLEWAEVYGNFYGTPRSHVQAYLESGKDIVLEIDTQGALQVKSRFPQGVFIFLMPPSLEELACRIQKRGSETPEAMERRLKSARLEIGSAFQYNYLVVNDDVDQAVFQIQQILAAEKCRMDRNLYAVNQMQQYGSIK
ncbi:MAG: guanylate kinase [Negativicutes bacterium]|nr:guanylate kinase [Negativicutes bacterium]